MADLTDHAENLVGEFLAGTAPTAPPGLFVELFTVTPTADDGTGGTPVSGGSYAREEFTAAAVSGGVVQPTAAVTFTTATASWGTVNGFGVYDAITGGNLLWFQDVTTPKLVDNGDTAEFAAADLTLTIS